MSVKKIEPHSNASNYTVVPRTSDALFHLFQHFKHIRHDVANAKGLNTSELELLLILAHSEADLSIKSISEEMRLCSQAITKISRALEKRGLVAFEKSQSDRRVTFVKLTPDGRLIVDEERRSREGALKEAMAWLEDNHIGHADHSDWIRETGGAIGDHETDDVSESVSDSEHMNSPQSGGAFLPSFLADSLSMIAERISKNSV